MRDSGCLSVQAGPCFAVSNTEQSNSVARLFALIGVAEISRILSSAKFRSGGHDKLESNESPRFSHRGTKYCCSRHLAQRTQLLQRKCTCIAFANKDHRVRQRQRPYNLKQLIIVASANRPISSMTTDDAGRTASAGADGREQRADNNPPDRSADSTAGAPADEDRNASPSSERASSIVHIKESATSKSGVTSGRAEITDAIIPASAVPVRSGGGGGSSSPTTMPGNNVVDDRKPSAEAQPTIDGSATNSVGVFDPPAADATCTIANDPTAESGARDIGCPQEQPQSEAPRENGKNEAPVADSTDGVPPVGQQGKWQPKQPQPPIGDTEDIANCYGKDCSATTTGWNTIRAVFHRFSDLPEWVESSDLECHDMKWRIDLVPGEEAGEPDKSKEHISVYLHCVSSLSADVMVTGRMRLVAPKPFAGGQCFVFLGPDENKALGYTRLFSHTKNTWGFKNCTPREKVLNHYLVDGDLIIEADIKVHVPIPPIRSTQKNIASDPPKLLETVQSDETPGDDVSSAVGKGGGGSSSPTTMPGDKAIDDRKPSAEAQPTIDDRTTKSVGVFDPPAADATADTSSRSGSSESRARGQRPSVFGQGERMTSAFDEGGGQFNPNWSLQFQRSTENRKRLRQFQEKVAKQIKLSDRNSVSNPAGFDLGAAAASAKENMAGELRRISKGQQPQSRTTKGNGDDLNAETPAANVTGGVPPVGRQWKLQQKQSGPELAPPRGELVDITNCYCYGKDRSATTTGWKIIRAVFHEFSDLPSDPGRSEFASVVECHDLKWKFQLFPGGVKRSKSDKAGDHFSVYLHCISSLSSIVKFDYKMFLGTVAKASTNLSKTSNNGGVGLRAPREDILNHYLVDGDLIVEVDINVYISRPPVWCPKETIGSDLIKLLEEAQDGETLDDIVSFEVGRDDAATGQKKAIVHAHCPILSVRCPELLRLADENPDDTPIPIKNIEPSHFRILLRYIYGGDFPTAGSIGGNEVVGLLEAAIRFGCTNLKLAIESTAVSSSVITPENMFQLLSFAHTTKLALLKEAAIKFVLDNKADVGVSVGYEALTPELLSELMLSQKNDSNNFWPPVRDFYSSTDEKLKQLSVSSLRSILETRNMDIDGSKEDLIGRLRCNFEFGGKKKVVPTTHVNGSNMKWTKWERIRAVFQNFADLPSAARACVESPVLECHRHKWQISLWSGGDNAVTSQTISLYLHHLTPTRVRTEVSMRISSKVQDWTQFLVFCTKQKGWGVKNFFKRSDILDPSKGILSNGNLTVDVSIRVMVSDDQIWSPSDSGVSQDMIKLLEEAGDVDANDGVVAFEVGANDAASGQKEVVFYAHRILLVARCPILATMTEGFSRHTPFPLRDVDPEMFHMLLRFVYGDEITPKNIFHEKALKFICIANRFGCTGLKLAAEAQIVSSGITTANCAELILLADASNLALLKEAAINYFVAHREKVAATKEYRQLFESRDISRELLAACLAGYHGIWPSGDITAMEGEPARMCVAALRASLWRRGKEIDGPKEMLIHALESAIAEETNAEMANNDDEL